MTTFNKVVGLALFLAICLIASSDAIPIYISYPMPNPYYPYWPYVNTYQTNNQYANANGGDGTGIGGTGISNGNGIVVDSVGAGGDGVGIGGNGGNIGQYAINWSWK
ncbi:10164_t:CDS:1 [Ambispora gerdemannii]|uniref:10164_t:CDS:1 n=1 Tax=Ambispora gerdemannii TaxID=144530 RepID=A0A9N9BAQ4_9GLOM|nr:10164_t:CDS:1 [Ambispora gerdemannii]